MSFFKSLTKFEWLLWGCSLLVVGVASLIAPDASWLSVLASLIGVTALIFLAKGHVMGQFLIVVFAALYGIISFQFRYYGEMITYLGMSAPMAVCAAISWLKNPYEGTNEVKVNHLAAHHWLGLSVLTVVVTVVFYFILQALGNSSLIVSTISVATSFFAASLVFLRSPYYALGYAANDVVLIVLWVLASIEDIGSLPMVLCFAVFLFNDLYGFFSWRRMEKRQKA